MNPILLKPTGERTSQVVVHGPARGDDDRRRVPRRASPSCSGSSSTRWPTCARRFDVVLCEGAGSPAEINLLDHDIVNLRIAHDAGHAGDRRRRHRPGRRVRRALRHGRAAARRTTARCVRGFRDQQAAGRPRPAARRLRAAPRPHRASRRSACCPWLDGRGLDAEDSLALRRPSARVAGRGPGRRARRRRRALPAHLELHRPRPARGRAGRGGALRRTTRAALGRPRPRRPAGHEGHGRRPRRGCASAGLGRGHRARRRATGARRSAAATRCSARRIDDAVESGAGDGRRPRAAAGDAPASSRTRSPVGGARHGAGPRRSTGYQIHHGRVQRRGRRARSSCSTDGERRRRGHRRAVIGTTLHGLFEADGSARVPRRGRRRVAGKRFVPAERVLRGAPRRRASTGSPTSLEAHLDLDAIDGSSPRP